jgi:hypothetical protein
MKSSDLWNRWVQFNVTDVYFPDRERLLVDLYGNNILQGRVVDVSEGGPPQGSFAVVSVEGLEKPVVVPVDRILKVL